MPEQNRFCPFGSGDPCCRPGCALFGPSGECVFQHIAQLLVFLRTATSAIPETIKENATAHEPLVSLVREFAHKLTSLRMANLAKAMKDYHPLINPLCGIEPDPKGELNETAGRVGMLHTHELKRFNEDREKMDE